jgi:tetratricopeptide (TPR) repeat protein
MITSAITSLLADILSPQITQGLEQSLYSYGLWVMMSVVGYVLFEFHQVLDFEVLGKKSKKRTVSKVQDKQQARLAVYLKEGAYEKAAALLKTQSEKQKNNPDIQEKYYQLLIFMQDADQVPIQASHYMEALLEVGQVQQALDVLMKVRRLVPDFTPPTPEMRFNLAKACVDNQHYELARDLLRHLHKEYPHYPQLPEAYLLLSKVLHDKLKASTEALETMEYLASRFQKHPRYELIERFWRSLGGKPKEDFIL